MLSQAPSVADMDYIILESVKCFFYLRDEVDSLEKLIEHTQSIQNILCDLKDKGWVLSANSGDWFELAAPDRAAAVAFVGEEYVKQLEEEYEEASCDD